MSEEFNDAHSIGYRAGVEAAIAVMRKTHEQVSENRLAVDPMELTIERLEDEMKASEPDRAVSVGPLPETSDA